MTVAPSAPPAPPSRESLLAAAKLLPASPQILAFLQPVLINMDTSIEEITDILRRDSALTARVIRIANSVAYSCGEPLGTIEEAVLRVGLAEVYRLTGFAILAQVSHQQIPLYGITGVQYRENALLTALIVQELGRAAQVEERTAYTAGLLRSTGKIALDRAVRARIGRARYDPYEHGPLDVWETQTFGCSNGAAAEIVLQAWRFPRPMTDAIRDHYACENDDSPLTLLLNLAAGAAERCGHGLPGEYPYWVGVPERCIAAGITPQVLDAATRSALQAFGPVRAALA